jgi:hypothetical protein
MNKDEMKIVSYHHRRLFRHQYFCLIKCCIIGLLTIILSTTVSIILRHDQYIKISNDDKRFNLSLDELKLLKKQSNYTYERFIEWNRSLCGTQSDRRGPHQKVISLSIFGTTSKFSNNPMYSWDTSMLPFLEPLANEVKISLPSWVIRIYVDFIGSTESQRDYLYNLPNVDVCDITNLPLFGSSIYKYLPGRLWRYLPIFDPYVDYLLSHDLDSPISQREIETLDMWLSEEQKENFFYIARDHTEADLPIPAGLWGAAPIRARYYLIDTFLPMLISSIGSLYSGIGDQLFLRDFIWRKVKKHSLIFDSYYCEKFGGQPFPSRRPRGNCFLGCLRPCCTNATHNDDPNKYVKSCPIECRPKNHKDWTFC